MDDDGNIILHVHPSVSVVEEKQRQVNLGDLGVLHPTACIKQHQRNGQYCPVQDGGIVAIGGLMSQEQGNTRSGLPGLVHCQGWAFLWPT